MAVWGAARRLASFVISGRVCWMVFMVSCLLAAVERMGVSQVRRVCFSWSFFCWSAGVSLLALMWKRRTWVEISCWRVDCRVGYSIRSRRARKRRAVRVGGYMFVMFHFFMDSFCFFRCLTEILGVIHVFSANGRNHAQDPAPQTTAGNANLS